MVGRRSHGWQAVVTFLLLDGSLAIVIDSLAIATELLEQAVLGVLAQEFLNQLEGFGRLTETELRLGQSKLGLDMAAVHGENF